MKTRTNKKELVNVYNEKGLNGLYAFLRKHGINYTKEINEFGLNCSKKTYDKKKEWLNERTDKNTLRFHHYCINVKSRKTGYSYNKIRGIQLNIL